MNRFDRPGTHWRLRQLDRVTKRIKWNLRRMLDTSAKEKVEAISMVVVGRNDNYGGDFTDRLRATMDWNYSHLPNPELIYVEWNKVEDRESDCHWIMERYPNAKCYIVPNSIHQQVCANPKLPMMEYFAKNLGIRRATNDWIFLVNADVFLGPDTLKNLQYLSKDHVYATHYKNIIWKGEPLTEDHITNPTILKNLFSTDKTLFSVVGNFILMHKDNWMRMGGYDETLTDVRLGVDNNGLKQIIHQGVKPMVLGDHFHLDHSESAIGNKNNPTHGNKSRIAQGENIPYKNPDNWGFVDYPQKQIAERIWEIQPKI